MTYHDTSHGYCRSCSLLDRDERLAELTEAIGARWAVSAASRT